MKGWLIVNGFLQSNKFEEIYSYLQRAANELDIQLSVKTSTELFSLLGEELEGQEKPSFALFWDKDYALAKRLEAQGIRLFNNAEAVRACDDKILTALAVEGKVRTPKTMIAPKTFEGVGYTDTSFLEVAAQKLGFPMVVKEAFGSFGKQVYLANDEAELRAILSKMGYKPFLLQEFIAASIGEDVRINVVGDRVVSAMHRKNDKDFRSNITGGGHAKPHIPTESQAKLAIDACRALGLDFAGVDVMFGEGGQPILCEVNSNPHFKSTYDCTGLDMSIDIMRYVKESLTQKGWLVYDEAGAQRNRWFIDECIAEAARHGLQLSLQIYDGNPLPKPYPDFALVRVIAPALNRDLEGAGTRVFNSHAVSLMANDKFLTYQSAKELGLPVMPTELASTSKKRFAKEYPLVVKSRAGHGGQEVFLLHTEEEYEKFFKAHAPDGYIVQQFCSEAGKDLRVYVLGGKILAGVLRSSDEDFRSNYSLGGRVESVPVPQEVQDMVKTLHDAYSFDFVGIDFIRHDGKWILNEVEDVVGSRMLYETTDLDAVKLYIEYVAGKLKANG